MFKDNSVSYYISYERRQRSNREVSFTGLNSAQSQKAYFLIASVRIVLSKELQGCGYHIHDVCIERELWLLATDFIWSQIGFCGTFLLRLFAHDIIWRLYIHFLITLRILHETLWRVTRIWRFSLSKISSVITLLLCYRHVSEKFHLYIFTCCHMQ
jgi:hypothetical protein